MENSGEIENSLPVNDHNNTSNENLDEEYTPKLFAEDLKLNNLEVKKESIDEAKEDQLFDQDLNEDEDFEIPAFLRRQKF